MDRCNGRRHEHVATLSLKRLNVDGSVDVTTGGPIPFWSKILFSQRELSRSIFNGFARILSRVQKQMIQV